MSFVVSSQHERVIITGDVIHSPAELSDPELEFVGDVDREEARRTRKLIIEQLAEPDMMIAAVHFPNSVFSRSQSEVQKLVSPRVGAPASKH
jgi:hypothetical protein